MIVLNSLGLTQHEQNVKEHVFGLSVWIECPCYRKLMNGSEPLFYILLQLSQILI